MASASYVSVDMAMAALAIVGTPRFLASANAYMLPGTVFAPLSWKKLLQSKDAEEVRRIQGVQPACLLHTILSRLQRCLYIADDCKCSMKCLSKRGHTHETTLGLSLFCTA
jgi:hypothetical protein